MRRLVGLAYSDLLEEFQGRMSVDLFCSTLGAAHLQRRLLAADTPNLVLTVHMENEFIQIRIPGN